jgi:hypothetical protein
VTQASGAMPPVTRVCPVEGSNRASTATGSPEAGEADRARAARRAAPARRRLRKAGASRRPATRIMARTDERLQPGACYALMSGKRLEVVHE